MSTSDIHLTFNKRPSNIAGLVKGFWGRIVSASRNGQGPHIDALITDQTVDFSHLRAFNAMCGIHDSPWIHPLYPMTYVYPLVIRILSHKKSTVDIFKSLNVRSWISQKKRISVSDTFSITCGIKDRRTVSTGVEADIVAEVLVAGMVVWECCYTFFYRGKTEETAAQTPPVELRPIPHAPIVGEWFLEDGKGFQFARISGDTNGIHFWGPYARMFGFKGAFAQPLLVLTRTFQTLSEPVTESFRLDQKLKGPVYYNNKIHINGDRDKESNRFDIYCGDNPKPCICCNIHYDQA
ncbi:MAG: hypothetical protein KKD44_12745 [Proteobacteria bacterium]|nr:hypothetical protein [Pseudomonadota bacterium]